MSVFKKPSELAVKPGLVAMIYGSPGSGKSTLACSAPGAVMIDTDWGSTRMNGAHQVPTLQVERWEQILQAIDELRHSPEVQTVVIDTVGKMLDFMTDYIKRTATGKRIEINRDGTLSLKGFGVRKNMFIDFVASITRLGKSVIFVAHDKEEGQGEDKVIRPEGGGSSINELMKELDLVGYLQMRDNRRTISFTPTDRFYAKNTCDMPGYIEIPVLIDSEGRYTGDNSFFAQVIDNYRTRVARNIENNRRLEELKELIDANLEEVTDAASANEFVSWISGLEHVYNSKAYASDAFRTKVGALPVKFDKETKLYVDAEV